MSENFAALPTEVQDAITALDDSSQNDDECIKNVMRSFAAISQVLNKWGLLITDVSKTLDKQSVEDVSVFANDLTGFLRKLDDSLSLRTAEPFRKLRRELFIASKDHWNADIRAMIITYREWLKEGTRSQSPKRKTQYHSTRIQFGEHMLAFQRSLDSILRVMQKRQS